MLCKFESSNGDVTSVDCVSKCKRIRAGMDDQDHHYQPIHAVGTHRNGPI